MSILKEEISSLIEMNMAEAFAGNEVSFKITEANRAKGYAAVLFEEDETNDRVLLEFSYMKGGSFGTKILLGADTRLGSLIREASDEVNEVHKGMSNILGADNAETISSPNNIVEDDDDDDDDMEIIIEKKNSKKSRASKMESKDDDDDDKPKEKKESDDDDDFITKKSKKSESDDTELEEKKSKKKESDSEKDDDEEKKALKESIANLMLELRQEKRYNEKLEDKVLKFQEDSSRSRKKNLSEILEGNTPQ